MPDASYITDTADPENFLIDTVFARWRRVHRPASLALGLVAVAHSALTAHFYHSWGPDALWFLGSGLGLFLLAVMNVAHVGLERCTMPTAPVVRAANWAFVMFGASALLAVPEPHVAGILLLLALQAVSSQYTLRAVVR